MNKFLEWIKKIFGKNNKLPKPETEAVDKEEPNPSSLNDLKYDVRPACIKENTKVSSEEIGDTVKYFINQEKAYNNGDVETFALGDASTYENLPHFAFEFSHLNYEKDEQKSIDYRFNTRDEYFANAAPHDIIITRNSTEEEVADFLKKYENNPISDVRGDMCVTEMYFKQQADGTYKGTTIIKSYIKTVSENSTISVKGVTKPSYLEYGKAEISGDSVFTYEEIQGIADQIGLPRKLPEEFEKIIRDGYKTREEQPRTEDYTF